MPIGQGDAKEAMVRDKELRLALVCYGGVSLAVYMHGIVKEVWHLARASHAFHAGEATAGGTAAVYHALLAELAAAGLSLRVLPDIVAGASAGGLNGIFLAQAVATGQSLDPLTDLWLARADVAELVDPELAAPLRLSRLWTGPLAWMLAGSSHHEAGEDAGKAEVRAKLALMLRARWLEPPFQGERFLGIMLDALQAMAAAPAGPRLLPHGQPLDLFVTVTDFTGHDESLFIHSPAEVTETEHRLVLHFIDRGKDGATFADAAELLFAGRATASFPGAFPAFTVAELDRVLADRARPWPGRESFLARALGRHRAGAGIERAVLIDGAVLANRPFRPAIEALRERPARREVDRRFVVIDPSPGARFGLLGHGDKLPGFTRTLLGALAELPRRQPIRDNLEALADRSARVDRLRGLVAAIRPEVEKAVEALFGTAIDGPVDADLLFQWRQQARVAAAQQAGYGYAAYGHLKLVGVSELIARWWRAAADGAEPANNAMLAMTIAAALAAPGFAYADDDDFGARRFLHRFDLGYRVRRLRLLARRLGEMDAAGDGHHYPGVRDAVFASLAPCFDRMRSDLLPPRLRPGLAALPDGAAALLDATAAALDLDRLDAETDSRFAAALAGLPAPIRRTMLLTFLGFAFYDVATLPVLQGEELDEFDPIKVDRISPADAAVLSPGDGTSVLKGHHYASFGAFFCRAWRENDYLWGRLHGAERLVDIVASALPVSVMLPAGRLEALRRRALLAVLDEEEPRLALAGELIASLRARLAKAAPDG